MQKTVRTLILSAALLYCGFASAQEHSTQTAVESLHQIEMLNLDPAAVHPDTPAPPLTQFVDVVCSAKVPNCEQLAAGATTTTFVHGGSYIYVQVWEFGYGVGETASQGGNALTSAYLVAKAGFCTSSTGTRLIVLKDKRTSALYMNGM